MHVQITFLNFVKKQFAFYLSMCLLCYFHCWLWTSKCRLDHSVVFWFKFKWTWTFVALNQPYKNATSTVWHPGLYMTDKTHSSNASRSRQKECTCTLKTFCNYPINCAWGLFCTIIFCGVIGKHCWNYIRFQRCS